MKKLLIIPFFFFLLSLGSFNVSAVSEENEYDRIKDQITGLVDSGVLPEWHLDYAADSYYQQYYTHVVANNLLESFAEKTEVEVQNVTSIIESNDSKGDIISTITLTYNDKNELLSVNDNGT